jgi:hypothetical protein
LRVITERPRFVLVTGLPRSGTSVVCSLLNSAANAAFLSEPHNSLRELGYFWPDKLTARGASRTMPVSELVPWLKAALSGAKPSWRLRRYDVVGVKEVFQPVERTETLLLDYALAAADPVIVTIRDPVETYAALKARFRVALDDGLSRLEGFMRWVDQERRHRQLRFVAHESLCADPIGHFNAAMGGDLALQGPLVKRPMAGFGDPRALNSTEIAPTGPRRPGLEPQEVRAIEALAATWFGQLGAPVAPWREAGV